MQFSSLFSLHSDDHYWEQFLKQFLAHPIQSDSSAYILYTSQILNWCSDSKGMSVQVPVSHILGVLLIWISQGTADVHETEMVGDFQGK